MKLGPIDLTEGEKAAANGCALAIIWGIASIGYLGVVERIGRRLGEYGAGGRSILWGVRLLVMVRGKAPYVQWVQHLFPLSSTKDEDKEDDPQVGPAFFLMCATALILVGIVMVISAAT